MSKSWTGAAADGSYDDAANWSGGVVPGAGDAVTIDPGVALSVGTSLGAAGNLDLGSLVTLSIAPDGVLAIGAAGGASTIDNAGTITLNSFFGWGWRQSFLMLDAATTTLTGGGVVLLSNAVFNYVSGGAIGNLLDNVDNTIEGGGFLGNGVLALANSGTIVATDYYALYLDSGHATITNSGLLEANGPNGLGIESAVANTGTILAAAGIVAVSARVSGGVVGSSGGEVLVNHGTIASAIVPLNGGSLVLAGGVLDGSTVTAVASGLTFQSGGVASNDVLSVSGGTLALTGGAAVQGGTLTLSNGSLLSVAAGQGATLDPAQLTIDATSGLSLGAGATLHGAGAVSNHATLSIGAGATLLLDGALSLSGGGTLTLADADGALIAGAAAGLVLTNSDNVIAGAGDIGAGALALSNAGTINANGVHALTLDAGATPILNSGLLEATGAGGLVIHGSVTNTGTILAAGGSVSIAGGFGLGGLPGATVKGGAYGASGAGTLALPGAALTTDAATISLAGLGATITFGGTSVAASLLSVAAGGTLALSGGAVFGGGNVLRDAGLITLGGAALRETSVSVLAGGSLLGYGTISAALGVFGSVQASGGALTLGGALTGGGRVDVAGTLNVSGGGKFAGTVSGAGTVQVGSALTLLAGAKVTAANLIVTQTLTLGARESLTSVAGQQIALRAAAGQAATLSGAGANRLSNGGLLAATGPGGATVSVSVANSGTIAGNAGVLTLAGGVSNTGTVLAATARIVIDNLVSGLGQLQIGATGTLALLAGAGVGQRVTFLASHGELDLAAPAAFNGVIAGFAGKDQIDLLNVAANGRAFKGHTLTLTENGGAVASLNFSGSYKTGHFALGTDHHGGTLIRFV